MFSIPGKPPVTITPAAEARIARLMAERGASGLRIGLKKGGCAGMEYTMELAETPAPGDEVVEQGAARVMIAPAAQMFLFGTEIDYETALLQARQEITKAQQSATDLENDRAAEIARERQQVEADIRAADLQLATNQNLVSEAMAQAPVANVGLFNENVRIDYKIVRTVEGEPREIAAEENTPVLPGDVVKVALAAIPVN